jgi:hypothetical protein
LSFHIMKFRDQTAVLLSVSAPLTFINLSRKLFKMIWKEVSKIIESISKERLCLLLRNFYFWYFIGIYILTGKIVQKYSLNDLEAWKFSTSHLLLLACFLATTTPTAGPSWEVVLSNHCPPPNPHTAGLDTFLFKSIWTRSKGCQECQKIRIFCTKKTVEVLC